jgi:hypothetical protein
MVKLGHFRSRKKTNFGVGISKINRGIHQLLHLISASLFSFFSENIKLIKIWI